MTYKARTKNHYSRTAFLDARFLAKFSNVHKARSLYTPQHSKSLVDFEVAFVRRTGEDALLRPTPPFIDLETENKNRNMLRLHRLLPYSAKNISL